MAEKSLPKPMTTFPPPPVSVETVVEVHALVEEVRVPLVVTRGALCPHVLVALATEADVVVEEVAGRVTLPLREGGIMAAVRTLGGSFLRTFSAMRNMARANCSALRRPFFSMSLRVLCAHTHTSSSGNGWVTSEH